MVGSMEPRPRIGLAGYGDWGRHILDDLLALGCDVSVAAPSAGTRRKVAELGLVAVPGIDDVPEVDGVVVAVPTTLHAEVCELALARGVPVFVEKPLAADVAQARRLAARGEERLFVMDKWRYHPGIEELARIARSGELGRVVGVRTTRVGWGCPHDDVDPVWILAPHDLAIGLEILGVLPPAVAATGEVIGEELWGIHALLGPDPWLAIEASATSVSRRREVRLLCEAGVAWLDDPYADSIGLARSGEIGREPELRSISTELPLLRELRAFVDHVNGGPPPKSGVTDAVLVVERLEELRRLALSA
jgi:predicted dehydrogenase